MCLAALLLLLALSGCAALYAPPGQHTGYDPYRSALGTPGGKPWPVIGTAASSHP